MIEPSTELSPPEKLRSPAEEMWLAALLLFTHDAQIYLNKAKPTGDQKEAFNDLVRCGPITQRLARFNNVDPVWISRHFKSYIQDFYRNTTN